MIDPELARFKRLLLKRKDELLELEESTRDAAKPVELDQASVGRLSRMDAMQSQQLAQEIQVRREQELAQIDGALRRITSGDFGYCFKCDEEMDPRRLEANPTLTRCIKCVDS